MSKPLLIPDVADDVSFEGDITPYDEAHFITYARLLDAEADGADWRDVTRLVLRRDPEVDPEGALRCWEAHVKRARWMTENGSRCLMRPDVAGVFRK